MRSSWLPLIRSVRGVRRKAPPPPVEWLNDATTYSDVHSVLTDPTGKLPYPEQDMRDIMEKSTKEILKAKNKAKYGKKRASGVITFDHIPIEEQCVLMFPGQGAQFVGMGKKVIDHPQAKLVFENASAILDYDIEKLCIEGPKHKLDQTLYCQPAVFVSSIAAWEKLKAEDPEVTEKTTDVAGFSVGEFAALVAGGILDFEDAMKIVKKRAEAMHECNQLIRSGMVTIRVNAASRLDDAMREARELAREKGEMEVCEIANYLFRGVRVVGASETCMKFLEENAGKYNLQILKRLAVSGAFHTRQMQSAVDVLRTAIKDAEINEAICNVYSNYTGMIYSPRKGEIRNSIAKQVVSPVKWEQIQQLLYRKHQDHLFPRVIECGPGRQLGAMWLQTSKKAYNNYESYSC